MKDVLRGYIGQQLLSDGFDLGNQDDLLVSGVDSVGMMSLVLFIEEEWQLSIPPEDVVIENFQTIDAIAAYVRNRLGT